ncbi:MAG: DUF5688 family protein [Enterocloster clostridioformis]
MAELLALYRRNGTPPALDYQMLSDYEGIRSHIACKLIHACLNEAILKDIPHILWMDLAIVFYLCIHEDDTGLMTSMDSQQPSAYLEHFPGRFKNLCPCQFSTAVSSCHLQHGCIIEG